jgi:hypothetical protein
MIVGRRFGDSNGVRYERNPGGSIGQRCHELRWSASVSGDPIDRPGVGIRIVGLKRPVLGVSVPVGVRELSRVLVVWIARVSVQERRLNKGDQQAR